MVKDPDCGKHTSSTNSRDGGAAPGADRDGTHPNTPYHSQTAAGSPLTELAESAAVGKGAAAGSGPDATSSPAHAEGATSAVHQNGAAYAADALGRGSSPPRAKAGVVGKASVRETGSMTQPGDEARRVDDSARAGDVDGKADPAVDGRGSGSVVSVAARALGRYRGYVRGERSDPASGDGPGEGEAQMEMDSDAGAGADRDSSEPAGGAVRMNPGVIGTNVSTRAKSIGPGGVGSRMKFGSIPCLVHVELTRPDLVCPPVYLDISDRRVYQSGDLVCWTLNLLSSCRAANDRLSLSGGQRGRGAGQDARFVKVYSRNELKDDLFTDTTSRERSYFLRILATLYRSYAFAGWPRRISLRFVRRCAPPGSAELRPLRSFRQESA